MSAVKGLDFRVSGSNKHVPVVTMMMIMIMLMNVFLARLVDVGRWVWHDQLHLNLEAARNCSLVSRASAL